MAGEVLEFGNVGRKERMEAGRSLRGKDKNVSWIEAGREVSSFEARYYYTARLVPNSPG